MLVDTAVLRDHLHILLEKQQNARRLIERLDQLRGNLPPELLSECNALYRTAEEFLRYYREQEAILEEMSNRYDATSETVNDMLKEAANTAEYLF